MTELSTAAVQTPIANFSTQWDKHGLYYVTCT